MCRELTKKFETIFPTTLGEAVAYYEENEPRGEYVLVLEGRSHQEKAAMREASFDAMSLEEHMQLYTDRGMDRKEAMKLVAKDRGISKREVYSRLLEAQQQNRL